MEASLVGLVVTKFETCCFRNQPGRREGVDESSQYHRMNQVDNPGQQLSPDPIGCASANAFFWVCGLSTPPLLTGWYFPSMLFGHLIAARMQK